VGLDGAVSVASCRVSAVGVGSVVLSVLVFFFSGDVRAVLSPVLDVVLSVGVFVSSVGVVALVISVVEAGAGFRWL
jgi:hypothetical protein